MQACGDRADTISSHAERFPSVFDARALTNCSLFALDADDFHKAADQYPAVKTKLQAWGIRSRSLAAFAILPCSAVVPLFCPTLPWSASSIPVSPWLHFNDLPCPA